MSCTVLVDIFASISQAEVNAPATADSLMSVEPVELIQTECEGNENQNVDAKEFHDIIQHSTETDL